MEIGENYLKEFKTSLRITTDTFDNLEILPLVEAALSDMEGVGININMDNSLHRQCVKNYLKAYFGENPNKTDWIDAYESLRDALSLRGGDSQ